MPISGGEIDILGVTVARCGPVEGLLHLPLHGRLTAMYGLNGAGKTQLLRLLRDIFEGSPPAEMQQFGKVDIHIRLRSTGEARSPRDPISPTQRFFDHLRQYMRSDVEEGIARLKASYADGTGGSNPLALESAPAALLEACDEQRVTFRAFRNGDGSWPAVFPAVSPTSPAGAAFLTEVESVFRRRRPPTGPRQDVRPPALADVGYWGSDTDPHWIDEVPGGLQVPLIWDLGPTPENFRLATVGGNIPEPFEPDGAMQGELGSLCEMYGLDYFAPGTEEVSEELKEEIAEVEARANRLLEAVLSPAPKLTWSVPTPTQLALGAEPRWEFGRGWPLTQASEAQRRWIKFALEAAMPRGSEPRILLLDEPESGLHRLAEHRIPGGLSSWAAAEVVDAIIVATHSPDLLSSPLVEKMLVSRDPQGGANLRPVTLGLGNGGGGRDSARTLGLSVGDLWALSRLVVVVEGIHDEWVFNTLLRSELDTSVATVLPMHGGTRLRSLAEARLLMDGTDAEILVVLDDLQATEGTEALSRVKLASQQADPDELARALDALRQRGRANDSMLFLHQFLSRAATLGDLGRVQVHGLSLPDVICYLDPDTILTVPQPWAPLIERWSEEAAPNPPKNLKGWLRRQRLLPDDQQLVDLAVEQAALRMSAESRPLHQDLVALGSRIVELGAANIR